MAISIDTVYQRVLVLANKEQRGYITPQEFNLLANQAQMSIFESYFYTKNSRDVKELGRRDMSETDISELMARKLKPFTTIAVVTDGTTYPANYQVGNIYHGDRVCKRLSMNEMLRLTASIRHAGSEPVYADSIITGLDILVYSPTAVVLSGVTCDLINKPTAVAWGYVVVNDKALYNADTTVDFLLHDSEEDTLVFNILELAGIVINKPGLVQVASQKSVNESQFQTL